MGVQVRPGEGDFGDRLDLDVPRAIHAALRLVHDSVQRAARTLADELHDAPARFVQSQMSDQRAGGAFLVCFGANDAELLAVVCCQQFQPRLSYDLGARDFHEAVEDVAERQRRDDSLPVFDEEEAHVDSFRVVLAVSGVRAEEGERAKRVRPRRRGVQPIELRGPRGRIVPWA
jgi:hypothetical protein